MHKSKYRTFTTSVGNINRPRMLQMHFSDVDSKTTFYKEHGSKNVIYYYNNSFTEVREQWWCFIDHQDKEIQVKYGCFRVCYSHFIKLITCCQYYLQRCKEQRSEMVTNDAVLMFSWPLDEGNIRMIFLTSRIDLRSISFSYISPQMGFFKRSDPYGTTMEKAQLKPQASSEA